MSMMDVYSDQWLMAYLGMDNEEFDLFHQCQMGNSLDDFITQDISISSTLIEGLNYQNTTNMIKEQQQTPSSESYSSFTSFEQTKPKKQLKTSNIDELVVPPSASSQNSSSHFLSLANKGSPPIMKPEGFVGMVSNNNSLGCYENKKNNVPKAKQGKKRVHQEMNTKSTTTSPAQCHIIAERRRREKLSQKFIALSAIVPGLKKMDKASVLGGAIKHMKHLQEKVNLLEEQTKKRTVQSAVFVNKSQVTINNSIDHGHDQDNTSSSDETQDFIQSRNNEEALPEIEAKVSDKNVLIRIHCEKNKGVIGKVVHAIEKFHLTVLNSTALPFGNHAIDITVAAQTENENCIKVRDLVKSLRMAFLEFM